MIKCVKLDVSYCFNLIIEIKMNFEEDLTNENIKEKSVVKIDGNAIKR